MCEEENCVLLLPDVKYGDFQSLVNCIIGLESYHTDQLEGLLQLLQIETKVQSLPGNNIFETCLGKEDNDEDFKQDVSCDVDLVEREFPQKVEEVRMFTGWSQTKVEELPRNDACDGDYYEVTTESEEVKSTDFHIPCQHNEEKPFKCQSCDKYFTSKSEEDHEIVNTGERPYTCDICNKHFSINNTQDTHARFVVKD